MEKMTTELYDSLDKLFRQCIQTLSRGNPKYQKIRDTIWDEVYFTNMPIIKKSTSEDNLGLIMVKITLELTDIIESIDPSDAMLLASVKSLRSCITEEVRRVFLDALIKEKIK